MKILIQIIKIVLIMMLSVLISILILINIVNATILNKTYILDKLDQSNYYSQTKKEIQSNFENYILQSGLQEDVIVNIVTEDKIKKDTKIIISNIYNETYKEIDTQEIEENLKNNIQKSLEGVKISETQQKAINKFIEKICSQYKETILHTKYETKINNEITKISNYLKLIKNIIIVIMVVLILIILVINHKEILRGIAQIGIILTASGIMYFLINLFINYKIKIENILILNSSVSQVIREVATNILDVFIEWGFILFSSGVIIITMSNTIMFLMKKSTKKDKKGEIQWKN